MTDIILSGCSGKMGAAVLSCAAARSDCRVVAGVDLFAPKDPDYTYAASFSELDVMADVIIDFSNPAVLDDMLDYAKEHSLPCIICTTGYDEEQKAKIAEASKSVPVFYSGNMSLGINLIIELAKKAASVFGEDFDVEIVEQHHNQKLDAPSGTALMIADAVSQVRTDSEYVYDRSDRLQKRDPKEIGISAVRGGTIPGTHEVIFAGTDEVVELTHMAYSRSIFGKGAISAAKFLAGKSPKFYSMADVIG